MTDARRAWIMRQARFLSASWPKGADLQDRRERLQRFAEDAMAVADANPLDSWRCECNQVNLVPSNRCGRCGTIKTAAPSTREDGLSMYQALGRMCIERILSADANCDPPLDVLLRLEAIIRERDALKAEPSTRGKGCSYCGGAGFYAVCGKNNEAIRKQCEHCTLVEQGGVREMYATLENAPVGKAGETNGDLVARYYHWYEHDRQYALDAHAPTAPLEEALELILPLAKGYAAAHPVGRNQAYVDQACAALDAAKGKA